MNEDHKHCSADIADALQDLKTHREAWRSALLKQQTPFGSDDDGSYWAHELRAFDRTFSALEKLAGNVDAAKAMNEAAAEIEQLRAQDEAWMTTVRKQEEELVRLRAIPQAVPESIPGKNWKPIYVKRWRTLFMVPASLADEIRDTLAGVPLASQLSRPEPK